MAKITGDFKWQTQDIIPAFPVGIDAKALYEAIEDVKTGDMGYDDENKTFWGSNPFVAARADTLLRPLGIRAANLRDLSRPEVMRIVKDNYYTDAPVLVLRSTNDSNSKNLHLVKRVSELVEQKHGKLEMPVMITGFDVAKSTGEEAKQGYGISIIPRDDFTVVADERLSGSYHGKKFNDVDELGLPKFDKNGSRTWYARNQGLSGLCLYGGLNLDSYSGNLAGSYSYGRVVLVSGEAAGADFMKQYQAQLQKDLATKKGELLAKFQRASVALDLGYEVAQKELAK